MTRGRAPGRGRTLGMTLGMTLGLLLGVALSIAPSPVRAEIPSLPAATWQHLPRWRGFNLLDKFYQGGSTSDGPFHEEDFQLISQWGFNFVRLPMDYREWISHGDWTQFNEPVLQEIDQAVGWGRKYGVHVCINFHRAPGYTVGDPPEKLNIFKDDEALRICALHWSTFARRYKGIPNENLSFNLFNEPAGISVQDYVRVVKAVVAAIRAEDSNRLLICDGMAWGNDPVPELIPLQVAQSSHYYRPMGLTHYQAPWVAHSGNSPVPTWPIGLVSGYLYGPEKKEFAGPLLINGEWKKGGTIRLHVQVVSGDVTFHVRAGGHELFQKIFQPGPGTGEWEKSVYHADFKTYQNIYNKDYEVMIPVGTRQVEMEVSKGDWLSFDQLHLIVGSHDYGLQTQDLWGRRHEPIQFDADHLANPIRVMDEMDRQYLRQDQVVPWQRLQKQGVGVMVGEFGVYNQTPHAVALAWMKDNLANWKQAGWGWALWNFRGSMGILDSGRADLVYEKLGGHSLDRDMLKLLQQY